ncbi:MAG: acetyl-CoA C-acyltransferase, partial [Nitrosomonas sp.]
VAGGAESMSRGGYLLPALRWGQRMNDGSTVDMMVGALTDPFDNVHMGITAENIATKWQISREAQDQFSAESHRRALHAIKSGYFKSQILPIEITARKETSIFDTDEHPRENTRIESLAKLKPVFHKQGSVTAGNASGINDSAAALVLMEIHAAEKRNLKPMARLVAYGHAGVDPKFMGIGPVPAVQNALRRANLKIADLDVIESNEAFAVQACAVAKELHFDPEKTNPNGGAVALGHPIGATGSILTIKAIYELHRKGGRYALVTMCIGGGQGIAAIFERL